MVEIYSYDITPHERYARDQEEIEAFRKQYHIPPSGARQVAVQTAVLDFIPKHSAVSLLFQTYQRKTWARFEIPFNFNNQRFLSSYVAPSLGSKEKQEADIQRIKAYIRQQSKTAKKVSADKEEQEEESGEEEKEEILEEGEILISLLEKGIVETNEMVDFVIGRMHQFVQA